jgi:hypothetical protein
VLVGIYLSVAGVLTLIALRLAKETRESDFATIVE